MPDSGAPSSAEPIARGVRIFLGRMIDDPLLSWTFEGADQELLYRHARAFIAAALGGPDLYLGRDLHTVHERFGLTDKHFDAAVIHLIESLGEAGISSGVLAELAIRLEPLRKQIVSA